MAAPNKLSDDNTAVTKSIGSEIVELHPQNFFKKLWQQKLIVLGSFNTDEKLEMRVTTASTKEVFAYAFTTELAALTIFPRAKYLAEPKTVIYGHDFFKRLNASRMGLYLNPGFEPALILTPAEVKLICDQNDD
jgi:hypothetical protein